MRVAVDQGKCIACGVCIHLCPQIFAWGENGCSTAVPEVVPGGLEAQVRKVMDLCPVNAIYEVERET